MSEEVISLSEEEKQLLSEIKETTLTQDYDDLGLKRIAEEVIFVVEYTENNNKTVEGILTEFDSDDPYWVLYNHLKDQVSKKYDSDIKESEVDRVLSQIEDERFMFVSTGDRKRELLTEACFVANTADDYDDALETLLSGFKYAEPHSILFNQLKGHIIDDESTDGQAASDYPDNWDELRTQVYKRDGYTCRNCGIGGGSEGDAELHAHHIVPLSAGGNNTISNLATLCDDCHTLIHDHL